MNQIMPYVTLLELFFVPSLSTKVAPNLFGKFKSTCKVPHCQSRPIASLKTNSILGP